MTDLAQFIQIQHLLEAIEAVEDKLAPNELEMYHALKARHADPGLIPFGDVTCLEVILRNVGIRKGYDMEPRKH
jgi:hypothetical protein